MKMGKEQYVAVTRDEDGMSINGEMPVLIDDSDPTDIKIYPVRPPGTFEPVPASPTPSLKREMNDVLSAKIDKLEAEIEKRDRIIDDRDEIIGRLAKDLNAANERMMQMFDKAMDVLSGD